jgi:hypothetical protein
VGDADGRVGGVDRLAAGTGGAEGVDAQIFLLDFDVDFFGFGQHGDGDGGGVDAALGFRSGNALHAMHAALVLHLRVDAVAFDERDDFLEAADRGLGLGEDFDLPAVLLGKALVHAKDLGDKERSLVAAGAGADFEDDVLFVVGVFGQQHDLSSASIASRRGASSASSSCAIAAISGSDRRAWLGAFDALGDLLVFAELFHGLFEVAVGFGDFVDGFAVVLNLGQGHLVAQLHVAVFHLLQTVKHGVLSSLWLDRG